MVRRMAMVGIFWLQVQHQELCRSALVTSRRQRGSRKGAGAPGDWHRRQPFPARISIVHQGISSTAAMRMTLSISAALVALWLAYAVSPFVSVYRLVDAVQDRDVAGLSARADFRAVRGSLAGQIARTYPESPASSASLDRSAISLRSASPLRPRMRFSAISFLRKGCLSSCEPADHLTSSRTAFRCRAASPGTLGNAWRAYLNSELGIARFKPRFLAVEATDTAVQRSSS